MNRTGIRARQPYGHCALDTLPCSNLPLTLFFAAVLGLPALLSGCAISGAQRIPIRDEAMIHVRLVDHIDYKPGIRAYGLSRCANGVCTVEILRDHYPYCLDHELRHVFEGDWHAGHDTVEGC